MKNNLNIKPYHVIKDLHKGKVIQSQRKTGLKSNPVFLFNKVNNQSELFN